MLPIFSIRQPTTSQRHIMGILGNIFGKIFPSAHASNSQGNAPAAATPAAPPSTADVTAAAPQQAPAAPVAAMEEVDVEAVLNDMAKSNPQKLNWRTSIVDLLKLLDLDSSLAARKELAQELNVHAGADGSAEQNIALHKAVMRKIEENGGKVPESLRH